MSEPLSPREELEQFVLNQIDARKERIAALDLDENSTLQHLAAITSERETCGKQIEDWMRWMGLLK